VSPLKIKIPSKNLGRQLCAKEFNSGVKGLKIVDGCLKKLPLMDGESWRQKANCAL
jgi:hypothetical protein